MQLNAISRLAKFMGNNEKITMIIVLFIPVLTTALLSGISAHVNLLKKTGKIQKRCLRIST